MANVTDAPELNPTEDTVDGGNTGGSSSDDDDDVDTNIIIVICVVIGLLLIVFIIALCKYMEMRRKEGKQPLQNSRSGSESSFRNQPEKYHQPMPKGSVHQPFVNERPSSMKRQSSKKNSTRRQPEEEQYGGYDNPPRKVYSAPLQADVTLPRQTNGGGPYGVVIPNIGKKTQGPTYSQGMQGTMPAANSQYASLPLTNGNPRGQAPVRNGSSSNSMGSLPSNGSVYQRADGFTVYDPAAPGSSAPPSSAGQIVPTQADIYHPSNQSNQGQGYSNYETVSHISINP